MLFVLFLLLLAFRCINSLDLIIMLNLFLCVLIDSSLSKTSLILLLHELNFIVLPCVPCTFYTKVGLFLPFLLPMHLLLLIIRLQWILLLQSLLLNPLLLLDLLIMNSSLLAHLPVDLILSKHLIVKNIVHVIYKKGLRLDKLNKYRKKIQLFLLFDYISNFWIYGWYIC